MCKTKDIFFCTRLLCAQIKYENCSLVKVYKLKLKGELIVTKDSISTPQLSIRSDSQKMHLPPVHTTAHWTIGKVLGKPFIQLEMLKLRCASCGYVSACERTDLDECFTKHCEKCGRYIEVNVLDIQYNPI